MSNPPPIIWSIAGNDSGGGAGLGADIRAAAAWGVHLCPVVAAITAQNSQGVQLVQATAPEVLEAQLTALAQDLPPAVIKTGLLGSAENVRIVAQWVQRLRPTHPHLQLVVDPVLRSSSGSDLADEALLAAYRQDLLPLADLVTPNQSEAQRLGLQVNEEPRSRPSLCVTGGDAPDQPDWSMDWVQSPQAVGWLALPRVATAHNHGTGCTFATSAAAALALGFVMADALVLAKMATTAALKRGYAAGAGAGPVAATAHFANDPSLMPYMSWGAALPAICHAPPVTTATPAPCTQPAATLADGIYAIADSLPRLETLLEAGAKLLQLRIKRPEQADNAWLTQLQSDISTAVAMAAGYGAQLFINDHLGAAIQAKASAVHLGQEDWAALPETMRRALLKKCHAGSMALGISSHSLWELARARSLSPTYIACGPVWATTTKDMPWLPQGLDNLSWWAHMAGCPVVGIGGVLEYAQATQIAQSGAAAACIVRGLGTDPTQSLPQWQTAFAQGQAQDAFPLPKMPHSSLDSHVDSGA
jgi:hydroxymethylpyrimidine kinase/phosphomethylpyrimidine kinase/thiamine-phosphate diphosphorylase